MPPPPRFPLHLNFHPDPGEKVAAVAAAGHYHQLCSGSDQFENAPAAPAVVVCAAAVASSVAVLPADHAVAAAVVFSVRAIDSLFLRRRPI